MNLAEVFAQGDIKAESSVPEWMLGLFRRRSISFANGETDVRTQVIWMQCRNFTLDLRLPQSGDRVGDKPIVECSEAELRQLANYEGWFARSNWQQDLLSWSGGAALQLHDRWPEPAKLKRVGNCMIEFAPSGAYVEDWRLANAASGPLLGAALQQERNLDTGAVTHCGGGLVICGNYAGLVLGRPELPSGLEQGAPLRDQPVLSPQNLPASEALLNFECSVARGSVADGFDVFASTRISRENQQLFPLDGFELLDNGQLCQILELESGRFERLFQIDSIEKDFAFRHETPSSVDAQSWFESESETIQRYGEKVC